jgi:hypothetical protein
LIGLESKEMGKTNCSAWPVRPLDMAA